MTTVSTVDPVKPVFSIIEKDYLEFADRISAIMAHPWTSESCRMPRELLSVHLPDYKEAGRVFYYKKCQHQIKKQKFLTKDDPAC